uniref:RNase H type-1 domain-containing protein n=1 Tax=Cannabis sativa TaxID=3483 RepID=A0A803PYL0_CANSA
MELSQAAMLKMGFAPMGNFDYEQTYHHKFALFSLNGEVVGHVQPYRGLRQGDPLSLTCSLFAQRVFSLIAISGDHRSLLLNANRDWWKFFWNLSLPPKTDFAWKLGINRTCPFGCSHAKNIWKESKFIIDFNKAQSMFNGDYPDTFQRRYTQRTLNFYPLVGQNQAPQDQSITMPPPKLSSTHPSNPDQQKLGIGAIIRSHDGMVVAALSKVVQGSFRSDEMEAKALFHALNWVSQSQLSITHIETDALRVSTALNSTKSDLSCFSDLIFDIRCLLSFFPSVLVSHAKRSANQAAHGLARFALGLDEDISWVGEIPYPIFTVVVNDLNL